MKTKLLTISIILMFILLFFCSCSKGTSGSADASAIDTTTKVLAKNVLIEKEGNNLISNDLQSALDNEMAIKLSDFLNGTTWTIKNKTANSRYSLTGQTTFKDSKILIEQGSFAAAGIIIDTVSCVLTSPIHYEMINDSIMYINWSDECGDGIEHKRDVIITIVAKSLNSMTMIGDNGHDGNQKISILTRVQ